VSKARVDHRPFLVPREPFLAWLEANGFDRCTAVKVRGAKVWKRLRRLACCPWNGDRALVLFVVPNAGPIDAAGGAFQSQFRAIAEELRVAPRDLFLSIWPQAKQ